MKNDLVVCSYADVSNQSTRLVVLGLVAYHWQQIDIAVFLGGVTMGIKCCYGCVPPKRHTACWGHCPDYAKEKAQIEKDTAAQRKQKEIQDGIISQKYDGVYRASRKKGRK